MIEFKPIGIIDSGAIRVGAQWQGQLIFSMNGSIQKIAPCFTLHATEADALQDARKLHTAITEQHGPFEFSGYGFTVDAQPWEDGYRGHILLRDTPGYPNRFPSPFDLQCESYQATREDALCEAYTEAIRMIKAGIVIRKFNEDGTIAAE